MDENARRAQHQGAQHLGECRHEVQLARGINHHGDRRPGVDEASKVHLPEANYESRVDREHQEKVHFASLD